jgi:peptidoglycan/LPS O-acetylase OafA/YrhL
MFVVIPYLLPSEAHFIFEESSPWWAYPLFLQNFLFPISTMAAGPLGVTWSLAMEEQFLSALALGGATLLPRSVTLP